MTELFTALKPFKEAPDTVGIFSDLDGTLSGIAPMPSEAMITSEMREVLQRLHEAFSLVCIVTGRDSTDARRIVDIGELTYIGNHGLEWLEGGEQRYREGAERFVALANEIAAELSGRLEGAGILIEKKRLGVAVHYRLAHDRAEARLMIVRAVEPLLARYPFRKYEGRNVVELKPDVAGHKGDAVVALARRKGIRRALYLGDDVTDVDAFKELQAARSGGWLDAVVVAVASDEAPPIIAEEADHVVASIDEVQELLAWLAG